MRLFRYMSYEFWVDTVVGNGFATQYPSAFDDAFEGRGNLGKNFILDGSTFDSHYSILCLNKADVATESDEMLMWSLYADHSKGVRIVLDIPDGTTWPSTVAGVDIAYTDVISEFSLDDIGVLITFGNVDKHDELILRKMYGVKPRCWEWEREYRLVVKNVPNPAVHKVLYDKPLKDGRKWIFFAAFLKRYIVGVDFGFRVDELRVRNDIEKVMSAGVQLKYRMTRSFRLEKRFAYQEI